MAKTPKHHNQAWSQSDEAKLKRMAATRPVGIIAHTLGRTEAAIRSHAHDQGVSLNPPERSPYGRPKR